jgi:REP element-mobilizing transposase RayT
MENRKLNRLKDFDYTQENIYFVTTCTNNKICYFGEIINNKMILNQNGNIIQNQIDWIINQYKYFVIHHYVIMPNHIHLLCQVKINENMIINTKIKSLSELIGAFKTTTSKQIHLAGNKEFRWQRSFHDHIVRNDKSFNFIHNYITNNPLSWELDKLYNNGL